MASYLPLDQAWTDVGWAQKAILRCHGLQWVPHRALERAQQACILAEGCLLGSLRRLVACTCILYGAAGSSEYTSFDKGSSVAQAYNLLLRDGLVLSLLCKLRAVRTLDVIARRHFTCIPFMPSNALDNLLARCSLGCNLAFPVDPNTAWESCLF